MGKMEDTLARLDAMTSGRKDAENGSADRASALAKKLDGVAWSSNSPSDYASAAKEHERAAKLHYLLSQKTQNPNQKKESREKKAYHEQRALYMWKLSKD